MSSSNLRKPIASYPSIIGALAMGILVMVPVTARAQANTQRGAVLGGLAGAVTGGLIGNNNGKAGAGAAIGGVVGAVTGGVLGNASDKERAAYQQQQYYQQQQQAIQAQASVSVADVVSMTRSGLSDSVIVNHIQQRGVQRQLQVPDIIALHQQGVRENVITSMQQAQVGPQRVARTPIVREQIVGRPVIVEEHIVVPAYAPRHHFYHHRPHRHHHHHGIHFRF
jgi:outer membrane lipoprotein SlyB